MTKSCRHIKLRSSEVQGSGWTKQAHMPDGTPVTFKADTCLKFAGCGDLKFSEYNKKADRPPGP